MIGTGYRELANLEEAMERNSKEITKSFRDNTLDRFPQEYRLVIEQYMNGVHHTAVNTSPESQDSTANRPEDSAIRARLAYFEQRYPQEAERVARAIELFEISPSAALNHNRQIVERIGKGAFRKFLKREPAKPATMDKLIKGLEHEQEKIPEIQPHILSHMRIVAELGNIGSHDQKASFDNVLGLTEFASSFNSVTTLYEWYFDNVLGWNQLEDSV